MVKPMLRSDASVPETMSRCTKTLLNIHKVPKITSCHRISIINSSHPSLHHHITTRTKSTLLTPNVKHFLLEWIQRNPDKEVLSIQDKKMLMAKTNLSYRQLMRLRRHLLRKQRLGNFSISKQQEDAIQEYLDNWRMALMHEMDEERKQRQQQGGIGKDFNVSDDSSLPALSKMDLKLACQDLHHQTGLPEEQIREYIKKMGFMKLKGTLKQEHRDFVSNYWKDLSFRELDASEKDFLQIQTGLSRMQINQLLFSIRKEELDDAGPVSNENTAPPLSHDTEAEAATQDAESSPANHPSVEETVHQWMVEHNYRTPTAQEKKSLLLSTGFTPSKLNQIVSRVQDPLRSLTQHSKDIIREWYQADMKNGGTGKPSSSDLQQLQANTQLSRQQIHRQLNLLRDGTPQPITNSKKQIIEEWLVSNNLRRPTTQEREKLRQQTQLNRQQLSGQLRLILKKLKASSRSVNM